MSQEKKPFTIIVEFTPHNKEELLHIAHIAKGLEGLNEKYKEHNIVFEGVSLTQNPGGNLSYDHQASVTILRQNGFPESLKICPHITGKDMNIDGVKSLLVSLYDQGITKVLALTGDLSNVSRGVFEINSLGILQLIRGINLDLLSKAKSAEEFANMPLLRPGAAVSPFKYTEASLAMQYIKARKKIREGAAHLTCQCGWDANRSEHLMREFGPDSPNPSPVPIIGNVLVVTFPVAKYMQSLAGCVVSEAFLEALKGQKLGPSLERAAQQLAMFRQLGYGGVDLGKPGEFKQLEHIERIVDMALEIKDWREFKDNITFPMAESPAPSVHTSAAFSRMVHNLAMKKEGPFYNIAKAFLSPFQSSAEREGALYKFFNAFEGFSKNLLYQCEHCGDCFGPENDYVCTLGQCEKGLNNPPCGDADPKGFCGNNPNHVCIGETMYYRLLKYGEMDQFKDIVLPRRNPELDNTSSLLNYYFGRDHAKEEHPLAGSGLIQIAEMLHASIPLPGAAMRFLQTCGNDGFTKPNRGLAMVEHIIAQQAHQGADYIDINIDALAADDASDLMRRYVRLVHHHGKGVPPSIDSSDPAVLRAGLEEWFMITGCAAAAQACGRHKDDEGKARPPLVNSIPYFDREKFASVLELRHNHEFSMICLLAGDQGPLKSAKEMLSAAKEMFKIATSAGFRPEEIFFDTVTLGISSDGCMDGDGSIKASHTHHSFDAIKQIRQDPEMKGVHAVLGVSNWAFGVRARRVGHLRAFIAAAQKRGLDAVIVDVEKQFGVAVAPPELIEFVEMFAGLDGNEESMMTYSEVMGKAREAKWL